MNDVPSENQKPRTEEKKNSAFFTALFIGGFVLCGIAFLAGGSFVAAGAAGAMMLIGLTGMAM